MVNMLDLEPGLWFQPNNFQHSFDFLYFCLTKPNNFQYPFDLFFILVGSNWLEEELMQIKVGIFFHSDWAFFIQIQMYFVYTKFKLDSA